MFEWMPILSGLCLGGLATLVRRSRANLWLACIGIPLIALAAILLSGEWRLSLTYFALDFLEVLAGFVISAIGTHLARLLLDKKITVSL